MSATIELDEMIRCVAREAQKRRQVYGRLVRDGRMNKRQADREIDVMDAVLDKLQAERGDGPIFAKGGSNL